MPKLRLDNALVEKGLAPSRNKAQAIIMAGEVLVNNQVETRADRNIKEEDTITLKEKSCPYVSRGGLKLKGALNNFNISLKNKINSLSCKLLSIKVQFGFSSRKPVLQENNLC